MPWRWVPAALALAVLLFSGGGDRYSVTWWLLGSPAPLGPGRNALRLGVDASYPPFAAVAADGSLWGFDVQVAQAVSQQLGVPLDLVNMDAGSGLDGLPARAYDGLLAGLEYDPDETGIVHFSHPYFDAGPVLLTRSGVPLAVLGRTIAVEAGSPWSDVVADLEQHGAATVVSWDIDASLHDLPNTSAFDSVLVDRATALEHVRDDASGSLTIEPTESTGVPSLTNRAPYMYRIALGRANRYLALAVDGALDRLRSDGTLQRLEQEWLGQETNRGD